VEAEDKMPLHMQALEDHLRDIGPLQVLAHFSFYGLSSLDGTSRREWTEVKPVLQHHVELMQATALRIPSVDLTNKIIPAARFAGVHEVVRELIAASFLVRGPRHLEQREGTEMSDQEKYKRMLLETTRSATQVIRNPAYVQHATDLLKRLYAPLDSHFEERTGLLATRLVDMWQAIVHIIERRMRSHMKLVSSIHSARSNEAAIEAFRRSLPGDQPRLYIDQLIEHFQVEPKNVRWFLVAVADREIHKIFTLTTRDLVRAYEQRPDDEDVSADTPQGRALRLLIAKWSLRFGSLAEQEREHFLLNNPVWLHPFIDLGDDNFFLPIPGLFQSFGTELLESIVEDHTSLKAKYESRRAIFLEEDAARLLRAGLPSGKVYENVLWIDPDSGVEYETDVLVVLDSHVLIVEAKAGKVSPTARRGAPERLKRVVGDLIGESCQQAIRLERMLRQNRCVHTLRTKRGEEFTVDTRNVHHLGVLSLTLADAPMGGASIRLLRDGGFLASDAPSVPYMSAYDLRMIVDLLSEEATLLHYLTRRRDFEEELLYHGNESDVVGFYLQTGFNVLPPVDDEGQAIPMILGGHHRDIAPWFVAQHLERRMQKPRPERTPWFASIINETAQRKRPSWSSITQMLLDVAFDDQKQFGTLFDVLRRRHRKVSGHGSKTPSHVMLSHGYGQRRRVLVGVSLRGGTRDEREALVKRVASQVKAEHPDREVFIVARDRAEGAPPLAILARSASDVS
jgi:hypothetical protein